MKNRRTGKRTEFKITDGSVKRYKTVVLTSVLAVGVSGGLCYLGYYLIRKYARESAERKSFDKAAAESFARRLKMAFENDNQWSWGTDEERVFKALNEIPSKKAYDMVALRYKDMYGNELAADLKDELSSAEADKVQEIVDSKNVA